MKRIRIGNDFVIIWKLRRGLRLENLNLATDVRVMLQVGMQIPTKLSFSITEEGFIKVEITPKIANILGEYRLIAQYTLPDDSVSDLDKKIETDVLAFKLVSRSSAGESVDVVEVVTDSTHSDPKSKSIIFYTVEGSVIYNDINIE